MKDYENSHENTDDSFDIFPRLNEFLIKEYSDEFINPQQSLSLELKFKRIKIEGNFFIDLKFPDVVLIHGKTGVGKSTLFQLMKAVILGSSRIFKDLKIDKSELELEINNESFTIHRKKPKWSDVAFSKGSIKRDTKDYEKHFVSQRLFRKLFLKKIFGFELNNSKIINDYTRNLVELIFLDFEEKMYQETILNKNQISMLSMFFYDVPRQYILNEIKELKFSKRQLSLLKVILDTKNIKDQINNLNNSINRIFNENIEIIDKTKHDFISDLNNESSNYCMEFNDKSFPKYKITEWNKIYFKDYSSVRFHYLIYNLIIRRFKKNSVSFSVPLIIDHFDGSQLHDLIENNLKEDNLPKTQMVLISQREFKWSGIQVKHINLHEYLNREPFRFESELKDFLYSNLEKQIAFINADFTQEIGGRLKRYDLLLQTKSDRTIIFDIKNTIIDESSLFVESNFILDRNQDIGLMIYLTIRSPFKVLFIDRNDIEQYQYKSKDLLYEAISKKILEV